MYHSILILSSIHLGGGRNSAVGTATCCWLEGPAFEPRWGTRFFGCIQASCESHPPPLQWVPDLFPGGKVTGAWRRNPALLRPKLGVGGAVPPSSAYSRLACYGIHCICACPKGTSLLGSACGEPLNSACCLLRGAGAGLAERCAGSSVVREIDYHWPVIVFHSHYINMPTLWRCYSRLVLFVSFLKSRPTTRVCILPRS
jgi:hypothetical protein